MRIFREALVIYAVISIVVILLIGVIVVSSEKYTKDDMQAKLLQDRLNRIEYAIDASISGIHERLDQLDVIEAKVYSYEDAMEAISLVLERNSGYFLYQELGVVVMSHDEYLRRGGN